MVHHLVLYVGTLTSTSGANKEERAGMAKVYNGETHFIILMV
jgi:hypothetical protein